VGEFSRRDLFQLLKLADHVGTGLAADKRLGFLVSEPKLFRFLSAEAAILDSEPYDLIG
jgi:hypothetical protein